MGCMSLGGHFNPFNQIHGSYEHDGFDHHSGDLINNVWADRNGNVDLVYIEPMFYWKDIVGRSFVIHREEDDLGRGRTIESLTTGNAGDRIDCAVIGYMNVDMIDDRGYPVTI